ncbi:MAG: efflux RND transporter periplasmic adaptor subunit [Chitinophagales bacterium]|nr:efflux RND transporter periplasmic adaptor subunit [Chitinophagales bacterium]
MKKYVYTSISLAIILAAMFVIPRFFFHKSETKIQLATSKVKIGSITNSVTATGTVEPVDQVDVGTQVSGLVAKIYVDYNSVVKKGQLLAELDKTTLTASLSNAQATYDAAQNQLNYQKQNYNRQKGMYEAGVISQADYEATWFQLQNAQTSLQQSKASLNTANTNLSYANIYSPIDGVILTKEVEEGQTVAASMSTPTLFTIAKDITKMQVEANVDEADIGNVKEGQRVSFTVDAYPDLQFSGKVKQVRLGATTTSNVVTYTVIIEANNSDQKLKPGLTATITIYTKELNDVTLIPAQALNFTPDSTLLKLYYIQNNISEAVPKILAEKTNPSVWVKKASGALEHKSITTGDKDGVNVQIISGLNMGEEFVINITETQSQKSVSGSSSPFMPTPPKSGKKATSTPTK